MLTSVLQCSSVVFSVPIPFTVSNSMLVISDPFKDVKCSRASCKVCQQSGEINCKAIEVVHRMSLWWRNIKKHSWTVQRIFFEISSRKTQGSKNIGLLWTRPKRTRWTESEDQTRIPGYSKEQNSDDRRRNTHPQWKRRVYQSTKPKQKYNINTWRQRANERDLTSEEYITNQ